MRSLNVRVVLFLLASVLPVGAGQAWQPPDAPDKAATPAAAAPGDEKPVDVYVGIYVNQIYEMSLKENRFTADFYIWFRWQGDEVDPIESFEVVNGRIDSQEEVTRKPLDGMNYAYRRVVATITEFWDVSRFPLDNHVIRIAIEDGDNEEDKLKYIADTANTGMNPDVEVPGWGLGKPEGQVKSHDYDTNYGDTSLQSTKSTYSQFLFSLPLIRSGNGYFLKLFFGLFVATAIAFLAFFIKPTEVDPRFGLGIGAIFAAVASEYVVTSSLPDTNVLTMADVLHMLAFVFIFLSIAESTYSLKLYASEEEDQIRLSKRLDRWSFVILFAAYVILSWLAVTWSWGLKL